MSLHKFAKVKSRRRVQVRIKNKTTFLYNLWLTITHNAIEFFTLHFSFFT